MTIEKKLLGTNPVDGAILPEAVSFDGTNDYLARTSDFTNNADGKTWTFSAWFYAASNGSSNIYSTYQNRVSIIFEGSYLNISLKSTTEDAMFESYPNIAQNTWNHILISCNQASTSQRHIYVNDEIYTQFNTYVNGNIDFTETQHYIGAANANHIYKMKGRIAHVFLDKTYRDLSVTANRRLFITADGKPSDTIPSNPIMYLPMKDAATAGVNSGTGGNFTAVGTLATAERGPNQDNCVASTFDGSADYLSKTNGNSLSNSKTITCAFTFMPLAGNSTSDIIIFDDYNVGGGGAQGFVQLLSGNSIRASFELTGTGLAGRVQTQAILTFGVHYAVAISFDTANSSKSKIYVNGVSQTLATNTMNNIVCEIDMNYVNIGRYRRNASNFVKGSLGELYFHNTYTDLATENPFWDSDTNRPNSLRKVIEDTGVTPAIAMPLIGNDAGNNLGSGGDFTVNSGPFTGARGGSEFWARSALFGDNKLLKGGPVPSNTHKITLALCYYHVNGQTSGGDMLFSKANLSNSNDYIKFKVSDNHQQELEIKADGANQLTVVGGSTSDTSTGWVTILISIDNNNTSTRHYYVDGSNSGTSFGTYTNNSYTINDGNLVVGGLQTGTDDFSSFLASEIAFVYFNESYIDFSQEVNRNKFIDQLGYPRDLTKQIEDGDIANPLVYLKMENTAALGVNSGTGGNFSYKDSMTAGSDFTI